jgi:hypothetical protein
MLTISNEHSERQKKRPAKLLVFISFKILQYYPIKMLTTSDRCGLGFVRRHGLRCCGALSGNNLGILMLRIFPCILVSAKLPAKIGATSPYTGFALKCLVTEPDPRTRNQAKAKKRIVRLGQRWLSGPKKGSD